MLESQTQFYTLISAVATFLDGWTIEPMDEERMSSIAISNSDGAALWLRPDTYEFNPETSRVKIGGSYPNHNGFPTISNQETRSTITVAANRGPEAIAKSIQSRFLPKYLPLYAKGLRIKQQYEERDRRRTDTLCTIAEAAGSEFNPDKHSDISQAKVYIGYYKHPNGHGHAEVDSSGGVRLQLSDVPVEVAERILGLWKESS